MGNRSNEPKQKRFPQSYSREEFYALEAALKRVATETKSERLAKMHSRVKAQLARHESAQRHAQMSEAAE